MKLYDVKLNWFLEITIIIIINFFSLNFIFIYGNTFSHDDNNNNSNLTIFYERSAGGVANIPPLSIIVDSNTISSNEKNELNRLKDLLNLSNLPSNNNTNGGSDYLTYHLIIAREDGNKHNLTATDLNITNEQRQLFLFLEKKQNK